MSERQEPNWPFNMDVIALRFHEDGAEVLKALRDVDFLRVTSCSLWWIAVSFSAYYYHEALRFHEDGAEV
jgi:hypothetical protein